MRIHDLRTNRHCKLKTRPLHREDLQEFVETCNSANRHERRASQRFLHFEYGDLVARDKASPDILWPKGDSLNDLDNLPAPDVLQQAIIGSGVGRLPRYRGGMTEKRSSAVR